MMKEITEMSARRLPAEWEKQSFLQLTFPHAGSDWYYLLNEVTACFREIIHTTAEFQPVLVVCDNIQRVSDILGAHPNIFLAEMASNDTWARDHGGITVVENNSAVICDFIFNGWGNKFDASHDNRITQNLFQKGVFQQCTLETMEFVLEGGSIESDGLGTILTTTECLLEKNRNPHLTRDQISEIISTHLGAERILWLNHGFLEGDDTDSHIDTLARFCSHDTIAYVGCNDREDIHFEELRKMKEELQGFTDSDGNPYRLVELPMPEPCFDAEGNRLPATYANFTIINEAVLVPVYGVRQDQQALEILRGCFPGRQIIGINCRVLIEEHGSLHCVTMQYPEPVKLACR